MKATYAFPIPARDPAQAGEMFPPNKADYLSQSPYIRGLQCHKSLYLDQHRPELRGAPTPEVEALWASGHEVGVYAHMLFSRGVGSLF